MVRAIEQHETPAASIWGLSSRELHDAFWHVRGVQCVRRGEAVRLQRAAEQFLLIEQNQLVLFNIAELADRLTWHNAAATRLRLVDVDAESYSERVICDANGSVERISRSYRPQHHGSHHVTLTSSRKLTQIWMAAPTRRDGWVRIRRAVPWEKIDHWRLNGTSYAENKSKHERMFIDALVEMWPTPGQAISGLREIEPGVWSADSDSSIGDDRVHIGPLWLGFEGGTNDSESRCIIGPQWRGDQSKTANDKARSNRGVELRGIVDIELAERVARRSDTPIAGGSTYQSFKRLFDLVVSGVALLMLSPIFVLLAALVVLEDGRPVFFGQVRQGRGGRLFKCWKFRSMHTDAERIARELAEYNVCDGPQIFIKEDPRVTRIGKVLRRTHLDELPQLWNVFVGEMSLVGPRPSPEDENQFCPAWRDDRLSVRPGITGLWQLRRTREPGEDFQEWIRYDIEYVRRASFMLDISILIKTVILVALGRDTGGNE